METVGFVPPTDLVALDSEDAEAFGVTHTQTLPPVAANRAGGDELATVIYDGLADVSVALQDGLQVVGEKQVEEED